MGKEFDGAVSAILERYAKYGADRKTVEGLMISGMDDHGFSLRAAYNGIRMCLAEAYNEHETFSVEDVMEITGESREEVVSRIEEMRAEVEAVGGDPDDYARPAGVPARSVHYFHGGLKM